jgi:murein DD-endopeptidase MepM/ murein hydrolase activator NlpD
MRCNFEIGRPIWLFRIVAIALLPFAVTACSTDASRFDSNPFQSRQQASSQRGHSTAMSRSSVQSSPLPPPGGAVAVRRQQPEPYYGAPSYGAPRQAAFAPAAGRHVHVVAAGETLMQLSRQYDTPVGEIARANNIAPSAMVKVGDRIVIPGGRGALQRPQIVQDRSPAQKPEPPQKYVSAPPSPAPYATAHAVNPTVKEPEAVKPKAETAAAPTFRWPVNGRIIQGFGPKAAGQHNDGINVSVPEGTPIKAAEDGVVAYAGNELKTYGNLVLIRHSNGFVTAYAHASEILVKRDEQVRRGQIIGKSGQTGSVSSPQVHFEIRKGSTPIDPAPLLAKAGNS